MPCCCLLGVEPDMKYGAAANTALSRSSNCGRISCSVGEKELKRMIN
ncbi:hypothetical protein HanPSC8_Chr17g0775161 [Helianthus annuus]|nr:hypothetical protein HanPSC8_Chr17g0775161 [Helianthus annuus]